MDALTRISYYFPTASLSSFWILTNLIVNNQDECQSQDRNLIIALLVIFSLLVIMVSFTDTYVASNSQGYAVLIIPFYGPVCFSLPSIEDKDRVYDNFYLKLRDYVHALVSVSAFLITVMFLNPVANCLYPSDDLDGTSRFADSVIRTIPILIAIITGLIMMCLGPPRQMLGLSNVPETFPGPGKTSLKSPYAGSRPPLSIPEGDEEYELGPPNLQPAPSRRGGSEAGGGGGGGGGGPGPYEEFRSPREDYDQELAASRQYGSNMQQSSFKGGGGMSPGRSGREPVRQSSGYGGPRDPSPGFRDGGY